MSEYNLNPARNGNDAVQGKLSSEKKSHETDAWHSTAVMVYTSDLELLDGLIAQNGWMDRGEVEGGQTHKDAAARKRLLKARKDFLHQLLTASPTQKFQQPAADVKGLKDSELLKAYEKNPGNTAFVTEVIERWVQTQHLATMPLLAGDELYYVDKEYGAVEHGKVCIAAYKNGQLESFSVDFDNGDFDEFIGSSFGTHFFRTEAEALTALK